VETEGALLGVFRAAFTTSTLELAPGDRLVVYSDGVEHAAGPEGLKGLDWMTELYRRCSALPLDEQMTQVMEGLAGESGTLRDDTTMLAVQAVA